MVLNENDRVVVVRNDVESPDELCILVVLDWTGILVLSRRNDVDICDGLHDIMLVCGNMSWMLVVPSLG